MGKRTIASIIGIFVIAHALSVGTPAGAVTPEFAALHRDQYQLTKDVILKKMLYTCGSINSTYAGINDLVAALQYAKKNGDPRAISAQLLAVRMGLEEKPALIRHIAAEIEFCEKHPNFPRGFDDSPEGPELISAEFYKIASHIENLKINHASADLAVLRKEAERVVFELFWTDSEKMRSLSMDILNFLRIELKEDIPFDVFHKPLKPVR
ncbi:MAG TPA: hypothetical protein PLU72_06950 [Candidatus Ozemobacteraceae bacterium]|nr:hypothetical protein [Candidatus Ozemobacteraceae bacterium]HQG28708.1 hypothetical protein [Candidatus Ozemobacteraceae bacterium]